MNIEYYLWLYTHYLLNHIDLIDVCNSNFVLTPSDKKFCINEAERCFNNRQNDILNENWGVRSDSDIKMTTAVEEVVENILSDFYDLSFTNKWSSESDYYNCVVNGISAKPLEMRKYVCNIDNDWIKVFNVYINISQSFQLDDAVLMCDNMINKYTIKDKISKEIKSPYKFNKKLNCIQYGSAGFISVDWIHSMSRLQSNMIKIAFEANRHKIADKLEESILHELKHLYDMYINNIDNDMLSKEMLYVNKNYDDFISLYTNTRWVYNLYNSMNNIQSLKHNILMLSYDLVKYIVLKDVFYYASYSEASSHLENFKKQFNRLSAMNVIRSMINSSFRYSEDFISYESPVYTSYLETAKLVNALRDYLPLFIKELFADEFYNDLTEMYKSYLSKLPRSKFFDELMDMFHNNCLYYLKNANARAINLISDISTEQLKTRLKMKLELKMKTLL